MDHHVTPAQAAFDRRKTGIGIWIALLYAVLYGGFVALSVFRPTWMGVRAVLGLNLAVAYGLALIVVAVVFALAYNRHCRGRPAAVSQNAETAGTVSGDGEG